MPGTHTQIILDWCRLAADVVELFWTEVLLAKIYDQTRT